jgi:hypothetical protein
MNETSREEQGDSSRGGGRGRAICSAVLIVIGCVLAPISVLTVWAKTTVLDTGTYVATVAPLATNQDVREAIATRVTKRVMNSSELVEQLKAKLPPRVAARASSARPAIEARVHAIALKVVSSPQFAQLWERANRRAQPQLVAALTGNTGSLHLRNDGTVELDLADVAHRVRDALASRGVDVSRVPPGQVDTTVELFNWPWLGTVQDAVDLLQRLAWLLPVLTLVALGGGIALGRRRSRCTFWSGLGVSAGMLVILIALQVGRNPYLDLFSQPEGRQAGGAAYDQVLHGLRLVTILLLVVGLGVAFGAWLIDRERAVPSGGEEQLAQETMPPATSGPVDAVDSRGAGITPTG